jgi:2-keto-3-deoxy-L-rhamnonate aldolase RhmA
VANESVITIAQIEQIEAVRNLDEILAVPGLTSIVIGAGDLSGSMGHMAETNHPDVLRAIDTIITKARQAQVFVGIGSGEDPDELIKWVDKGVQWLQMGSDYSLMLRAAGMISSQVRDYVSSQSRAGGDQG